MPEIPECLNRRFKVIDDLIDDINLAKNNVTQDTGKENVGINLMCKFWDILKDDPSLDLKSEVLKRLLYDTEVSKDCDTSNFKNQKFFCYMAKNVKRSDSETSKKLKNTDSNTSHKSQKSEQNEEPEPTTKKNEKNEEPEPTTKKKKDCCSKIKSTCSKSSSDSSKNNVPLSKVLCNLNEAASFDKKCSAKADELMDTQKRLKEQVKQLEAREKNGQKLLKEADCIWTCMEEAYKKKIAESQKRQNALMEELRTIDQSVTKWRKTKRELELQNKNLGKCEMEIKEKIVRKNNDIKTYDSDIKSLNRRADHADKEIESLKKSVEDKRKKSEEKVKTIQSKIESVKEQIENEKKRQKKHEEESKKFIKDAREDLGNLCKLLLQKRLEQEDLMSERKELELEIGLVQKSFDSCKERCKSREIALIDENKKLDKEIKGYKNICTKCHKFTDTYDKRKFCSDCPKCLKEKECLFKGDHCENDPGMDCVCMGVKQKFIENVFDNMSIILCKQIDSKEGKTVAESVFECLKKSRNGKIDGATKLKIQDFILKTLKRNLNLTVVGGAVKTRCEMDRETYVTLMKCLQKAPATPKKPKTDKGVDPKKGPCDKWENPECNCPKGPKDCICKRKAPNDPKEEQRKQNEAQKLKEKPASGKKGQKPVGDEDPRVKPCTYRDSKITCGPDCANPIKCMYPETEDTAENLTLDAHFKKLKPRIEEEYRKTQKKKCCDTKPCPHTKNMKTTQYMFGSDIIQSSYNNQIDFIQENATTSYNKLDQDFSIIDNDTKWSSRENILKEIMGFKQEKSPIEVSPIETVPTCACEDYMAYEWIASSTTTLTNNNSDISTICSFSTSHRFHSKYKNKAMHSFHLNTVCPSNKELEKSNYYYNHDNVMNTLELLTNNSLGHFTFDAKEINSSHEEKSNDTSNIFNMTSTDCQKDFKNKQNKINTSFLKTKFKEFCSKLNNIQTESHLKINKRECNVKSLESLLAVIDGTIDQLSSDIEKLQNNTLEACSVKEITESEILNSKQEDKKKKHELKIAKPKVKTTENRNDVLFKTLMPTKTKENKKRDKKYHDTRDVIVVPLEKTTK